MNATNAIFYVAILIISVVIHEISHGFMAERFGDKTARYAGRLTLNPINHLDLLGSIIVPGFLILTGAGFLFGWAKPVPYNPDNLSNRKWGTIAVASAGVLANFFIAIIFGVVLRFTIDLGLPPDFYFIISAIVMVNLGLGIFNLVPLSPLDGSRIFTSLLPQSLYQVGQFFETYSIVLLIVFVMWFSDYLSPILSFLFGLITGLAL